MLRRKITPPLLAAAGIVALALAWLFTVPPGGGFDEKGHHVKALGVGGGDWMGNPLRITPAERAAFLAAGRVEAAPGAPDDELVERILRFQERTTRQFDVPIELLDPRFGCTAAGSSQSADCLDGPALPERAEAPSAFGTYQPYSYVMPGLLGRIPSAAEPSLYAARAGTLLATGALLAAALFLLWVPRAGAVSLAGPALAITPGVLLLTGTLSTSGPEIAGAVCLAAALIRLLRDPQAPRWAWGAAAAAALVLATARPLGPGFVVAIVVALALLAGPRRVLAAVKGRRPALLAAVAAALGVGAGTAWQLAHQPSPDRALGFGDALQNALERLPELGRQAVGVFGAQDAPMPLPIYLLWGVLLAALVAAAFAGAGRRERLGIVGLCAGVLVATIALAMLLEEQAGGQGRYMMPLLVLVPLWAGDLLARSPGGRRFAPAAAGVIALTAAVQLLGFATAARRHAVGTDEPWNFLGSAEWSPPGSWWLWLAVALLAAAALVAAGASGRRPWPAGSPACPSRPQASRAR